METRVVGRKRALLASTTLVSGEQIGGRRAKEAKCMISHMAQVDGWGETEFNLERHLGHKWPLETRVVGGKQVLLASTTLVSGEQIGRRLAKETKSGISHLP